MLKIHARSLRTTLKSMSIAALLLGTCGFVGYQVYDSAPANALSMDFAQVGTHPRASALLGTSYWYGPQLQDMAVSNGKLYAGYGDWQDNSDSWGPSEGRVALVPFDIAMKTFESENEILVGSEAIANIREINGALYVPSTDPSIHGSGGYTTNVSGSWEVKNVVPDAVHVFDVATLTGTDLWLIGARDNYPPGDGSVGRAMTWRSTDGGQTWNEAISDGSDPGQGQGFERYYWGQKAGSKLFLHASGTVPASPMRSFDGTVNQAYENGAVCASRGNLVVEFLGQVVCSEGWINDSYVGMMSITQDGSGYDIDEPGGYIVDFYIDGSYLYSVDNGGGIHRTDDLQTWTSLGIWENPSEEYATSTSIAVANDRIYIGDSRANIHESTSTISAELAISGPETCFEVDNSGVLLNYYSHENDNPSNPECSRNVVIPAEIDGITITQIGSYAFESKGIQSVDLPATITRINAYAFNYNDISTLNLKNGIDHIGYSAFASNRIASLTLPDTLTELRASAFWNNEISSVSIPNTLTVLEEEVFAVNKLTNLSIPSTIEIIEYGAFSQNLIDTLTIPNSVIYIGEDAFNHNKLRSLTLSNGLTEIPDGAFSQNKLKQVTIPNSVTYVSTTAFIEQTEMDPFVSPQSDYLDKNATVSSTDSQADTLEEYLASIWYARLYTQDPSNPNNLTDEAFVEHIDETVCQQMDYDAAVADGEMSTYDCGGTNYQAACVGPRESGDVEAQSDCGSDLNGDGDSEDIFDANYGGHLINPAYVAIHSETKNGSELASVKTLTGKADERYVEGYMVKDGPVLLPTPEDDDEVTIPFGGVGVQAAGEPNTITLAGSYFKVGQTVQIPASFFPGYTLAAGNALVSIVLTAAVNEYTFVYELASGSVPGSPNAGGGLALSMGLLAVVAVAFIIVSALLLRRKATTN